MKRPTVQPARQPRFDARQYEQLKAVSGAHSRISQSARANQAEADLLRVRQARIRLSVGSEPTKHPELASVSAAGQPDFPLIQRVIELRRRRLGRVGAGASLTKPDCLPTSSILPTPALVSEGHRSHCDLQSAPSPSPESVPEHFSFSGSVWNPVSRPVYATVTEAPIARPGPNDANGSTSWSAKQAESRSALGRSRLKHYFKLWRDLQLQRRAYQQLLAEQRRDRRLVAVADAFQRKILLAEAWRTWTADLKVAGAQRNEAAIRIQAWLRGELTRRRLPAQRASMLAERRALLHHKRTLVGRAFVTLAQYMVRKRRWRRTMQSKYATWGPTMYLHTGKRFNPRWWFSREGKTVMSEEYYKWRLVVVAFTKLCLHTAKRGAEDVQ